MAFESKDEEEEEDEDEEEEEEDEEEEPRAMGHASTENGFLERDGDNERSLRREPLVPDRSRERERERDLVLRLDVLAFIKSAARALRTSITSATRRLVYIF